MEVAEKVAGICKNLGIPYIFKASYRKANRTSASSFTGLGDEKALEILHKVRNKFSLPVVSDIHAHEEAALAAKYVDVLQIPAFLCRQTDLLIAAAQTGKVVNVKKGQFLSGPAMKFAAEKIRQAGNDKVMLTERGTTFGYQDLVVDFIGQEIDTTDFYSRKDQDSYFSNRLLMFGAKHSIDLGKNVW